MKLAILSFTRKGCDTARRAAQVMNYSECRMFTMEKFAQPDFEVYHPPLTEFTKPLFAWADTLLFVGSIGMAIRAIAPWVKDKKTDPAVLSVDEQGRFVTSLLSGHIGGANAETQKLAQALKAVPVITTATDVNGRFAVDEWAARNRLHISDMAAAKAVAAAILENDVPLMCDFPVSGQLPGGVFLGDSGKVGIYIGYRDVKPFDVTLRLVPRCLNLGIGCRRGITAEQVENAVRTVLGDAGIPIEAAAMVCSIDLKAAEPGLLEFCRNHELPATFYSAEQLRGVAGDFPPSAFVSSVTGVDNVCQRAAMLDGRECIIEKTAVNGVTVAVAVFDWRAEF